ncbi:response regulator transcription factor [Allohahella marinimesophila]|uniref:Response regulator transcription factor n=1 Tax=Allohahella marinimesophila TaxID=1054972 RepID=A0ABP7NHK4_9GAMM
MSTVAHQRRDVVLVVDDSAETLAMLNDTLQAEGLTVLVALGGAQAITIAGNITPDIILLDALMPAMDGFETCRRLKQSQELSHIPVIFMTGLSDTESIVQGFEAGGVDYVTKPLKAEELIARMRVHLANARLTQSARMALDSAGQFLMAVDGNGALSWATPQVHLLFERHGMGARWLDKELPERLRQFLLPAHNRDKGLTFSTDAGELQIRHISRTGPDEILLRLIDPETPEDTTRLRTQFALTEREAEVMLWVTRGKANREIATILSMSPRTVNKHLEQVFRKLGVENRTSAAALGLKLLMDTGTR